VAGPRMGLERQPQRIGPAVFFDQKGAFRRGGPV
jgi:hypothetical protein